jgi:hypothetical protein
MGGLVSTLGGLIDGVFGRKKGTMTAASTRHDMLADGGLPTKLAKILWASLDGRDVPGSPGTDLDFTALTPAFKRRLICPPLSALGLALTLTTSFGTDD